MVLAKVKLLVEVLKVKNQDPELQLKHLKEVKCLYIEDYRKRGFKSLAQRQYCNYKFITFAKIS